MPVELITVDDAAAWASSSINDSVTNTHGWTYFALHGTDCKLVYAARDGVVAGSGKRAETERPSRAYQTEMRFRMRVKEEMTNSFGTVHGGCLATVIDTLSSFLMPLHSSGEMGQPWLTFGVSQTLTVNYLAPTRVNKWIEVAVKSLSVGKNVALLDTQVYELAGDEHSERKVLTATSTHNKVRCARSLPGRRELAYVQAIVYRLAPTVAVHAAACAHAPWVGACIGKVAIFAALVAQHLVELAPAWVAGRARHRRLAQLLGRGPVGLGHNRAPGARVRGQLVDARPGAERLHDRQRAVREQRRGGTRLGRRLERLDTG